MNWSRPGIISFSQSYPVLNEVPQSKTTTVPFWKLSPRMVFSKRLANIFLRSLPCVPLHSLSHQRRLLKLCRAWSSSRCESADVPSFYSKLSASSSWYLSLWKHSSLSSVVSAIFFVIWLRVRTPIRTFVTKCTRREARATTAFVGVNFSILCFGILTCTQVEGSM